ncbi:hypothetical protein DYBT9275_01579 [Dyadobacter sp. CECT 9275]|uniref:Lipocalin-like domain-containing protein n=1 Tax=Dyadobacter helix TaxID=2822344 RepID=A0A916JAB6_9BACT|nr:hypothetical protein [Dyadobacter sp. CECT 9275]CAG4995216.1 hypothetical protein DYBT9275_01579 [Dyadobacter sp. CECT 9275]
MRKLFSLLFAATVLSLMSSCKDKDNGETPSETEKGKILISYPWKMSQVTDLSGKTIPSNQLNAQTQYIPALEIQFVTGNKVYAKDEALQVQNGGTWYLVNNNGTLNIDIIGFEGEFGVEELTNSKMRLRSKMPVSGVEQETIMVFAPVIK